MTKRTDIHSEANLDPADYSWVGVYDACADDYEPTEDMLSTQGALRSLLETMGSSVHGLGQCAHCGAHIRYHVVLRHQPTDTFIPVGMDCAEGRFNMSRDAFKAFMADVNARREQAKLYGAGKQWRDENADVVAFLRGYEGNFNFLLSLQRALSNYGSLTENQTKAAKKSMAREVEFQAKAKARQAERDAQRATAEDCPEGRIQITGEIVKLDSKETYYGVRWVMTVRDDRGFLVWGTQPTAFDDAEKGDRVTFMAAVEQSDKDPKFGFFKRPTKAEYLVKVESEAREQAAQREEWQREAYEGRMRTEAEQWEDDRYNTPRRSDSEVSSRYSDDAGASEEGLTRCYA